MTPPDDTSSQAGLRARAPRFPADLEAQVHAEGMAEKQPARVKNLCDGGLLVEAEGLPDAGRPCGLEIAATPGLGRLLIAAEVVWRAPGRAGLKIHGMMPRHRERFNHLLGGLSDRQPA